MDYEPIATGKVVSLCTNGLPAEDLVFRLEGPQRDKHCGLDRRLSGHDRAYMRTSTLEKRDRVFNWRSWTGLAVEEIEDVEKNIEATIPVGILQENIRFSGIPNFSHLPPTSRLVFPRREIRFHRRGYKQAILAVWEENGPCRHVGEPLEKYHGRPGLMTQFIQAAQHKRGVTGFVLSGGLIKVGDPVLVYPPVT